MILARSNNVIPFDATQRKAMRFKRLPAWRKVVQQVANLTLIPIRKLLLFTGCFLLGAAWVAVVAPLKILTWLNRFLMGVVGLGFFAALIMAGIVWLGHVHLPLNVWNNFWAYEAELFIGIFLAGIIEAVLVSIQGNLAAGLKTILGKLMTSLA